MAYRKLPDGDFLEKHRDKLEYGAPSGCILWTGCVDRKGYGSVKARGKKRYAHREAHEAIHGPGSANGLVVRHRCDTPACVNPAHLEIGTQADNMRDMMERGRNAQLKGEAHGSAKLTEDEVRYILATCVPGCRINGVSALARWFGVTKQLISLIVRREIWTHVS